MINSKVVIKNAQVVLENGIIWDGVIFIENGIIQKVGNRHNIDIPENANVIDANGAYVGPGFVDIHVHGGAGQRLFSEPEKVAAHFLKHGETSILASWSGAYTYEETLQGIRNVKKAMKTAKTIKGINMEGPYMNPNHGAWKNTDTWYRGKIDEKQYKPIVDELGDAVKLWSIAPEREGIMPFVEYARKVNPNVVFSVGHSEATPEDIRNLGTKYRPKLTTHLMNATGRITGDSGGLRGYGPDEYCLADPEMYAELISDSCGVHVHSDLQRMIVKNKGINRVVLITDSTNYAGKNPVEYAHVDDISFNDQGMIAGSKLTLDKACRNIMSHTNCGIAQAFVMASLNPAKVIGMDDEIGSIEPGKIADLVFVDDKFNVQQVMVCGEICDF